jgi:serine/threonine-protein kinase
VLKFAGPRPFDRVVEHTAPRHIGKILGDRYIPFEPVGAGAMGTVYKAHCLHGGDVVAIKIMRGGLDPTVRHRFERELRATKAVRHAGSVRMLDSGTTPDGDPYMVMELLHGRDLRRLVQEDWPLPEARIAELTLQLLDVLVFAHRLGIVHRDLKPENIVVVDQGRGAERLKVCDFGLAKLCEEPGEGARPWQTHGGTTLGTPEYMAPEQSLGEPCDARADVYSVGVLLYQMLTGCVPFTANTPVAAALMHMTEVPEPPRARRADVDARLEAVCVRALAKRAGDRFQSADEMRRALAEIRPHLAKTAAACDAPASLGEVIYPPSDVRPRLPRGRWGIAELIGALRPRPDAKAPRSSSR